MGALVVINDGTRSGTMPAFKLVDGQQRLTTISLVLHALGTLVKDNHPSLAKKIRKLLVNSDEVGLLHFKLLPTTKLGDRDAYIAALDDTQEPFHGESRIPKAYSFFEMELKQRLEQNELDPERLFIVLTNCLQVVFIDLDQRERPYEIFESLNAKGKALSQADLIRNYIAIRLPESMQAQAYEKHWSKVEALLLEKRSVGKSRLGEMTAFLRHYLAFRTGVLANEEHVYERFRDRVESESKNPNLFMHELETLAQFAEYYDRLLRPDHEPDPEIRRRLERLDVLETVTAFPFLLAILDAFKLAQITRVELVEVLDILEGYLVRRFLVGEPSNFLNKMFPTLWRVLDPSRLLQSLRETILARGYPSDSRVRRSVLDDQIDNRSQTRAKIALVLESVNRYLSRDTGGFTVLDGHATLEHIMPQSENAQWKADLGPTWEQVHESFLNVLGNLTLVTQEWNSALSNASFSIKKPKLQSNALRLNSDYFSRPIPLWNESAIRERGESLAVAILQIWPAVGTPPSVQSGSSGTPRALSFLRERVVVHSWRDVAYHTARILSGFVDFENIVAALPNWFRKEAFRLACRQLTNGWWVYLNVSAADTKKFCKDMLAAAGVGADEWIVEIEGE